VTTNEYQLAATILIGNKVYTFLENVAAEVWEPLGHWEKEGLKLQLKSRLAATISHQDLVAQVQVGVVDPDNPTASYSIDGDRA